MLMVEPEVDNTYNKTHDLQTTTEQTNKSTDKPSDARGSPVTRTRQRMDQR